MSLFLSFFVFGVNFKKDLQKQGQHENSDAFGSNCLLFVIRPLLPGWFLNTFAHCLFFLLGIICFIVPLELIYCSCVFISSV